MEVVVLNFFLLAVKVDHQELIRRGQYLAHAEHLVGYFAAGQVGQGSGACQQLLQFLLLFGDLHAQAGALGFLFHGLGAFLGGCVREKPLG